MISIAPSASNSLRSVSCCCETFAVFTVKLGVLVKAANIPDKNKCLAVVVASDEGKVTLNLCLLQSILTCYPIVVSLCSLSLAEKIDTQIQHVALQIKLDDLHYIYQKLVTHGDGHL